MLRTEMSTEVSAGLADSSATNGVGAICGWGVDEVARMLKEAARMASQHGVPIDVVAGASHFGQQSRSALITRFITTHRAPPPAGNTPVAAVQTAIANARSRGSIGSKHTVGVGA